MIWLKKFLMDKRWRHQIWKAWLPTKMWWCQKWQTRLNVDKMATSLNTAGEPSFCAARHETVHVHLSKYINSEQLVFNLKHFHAKTSWLVIKMWKRGWIKQGGGKWMGGDRITRAPVTWTLCWLFRWQTAAHCFCVYKNCEESTLHTCWTHHLSQNALQSNFM